MKRLSSLDASVEDVASIPGPLCDALVNQRQIGLLLRAVGPIIQIVGIILFVDGRRSRIRLAGMSQTMIGLVLIAVGLALVVAGLWMTYSGRKKQLDRDESDYNIRL
jgi:Ca2+/Na+ antiporter